MKPLSSNLDDLDEVDETSLLYVHYRCLGLMGMVRYVDLINVLKRTLKTLLRSSEEISVNLTDTSFKLWYPHSKDKSIEAFEGESED